MRNILLDFRFGLRVLRGSPGFSAVAVLTLALGIAANTTVFNWIDNVLLNPVPGARAVSELAVIETVDSNGELFKNSYPDFRDYRDGLRLVSGAAATFSTTPLQVGDGETGQLIFGEFVTGGFFSVFGIEPARGRFFAPEESTDAPGSAPVAVISHRLWLSRFHGDPRIIGKNVRFNRCPLTIIGIAPPGFYGSQPALAFDAWIPLTMIYELNRANLGMLDNRWTRNLDVFTRLTPGANIHQARAELAARARELAALHKSNIGITAALMPIAESRVSGPQAALRRPLEILMAVCALVLLIVCANVANLLLARASSRQKEFGIRLSMGATRWRLARQLLLETLMLAGGGALVGTLLAQWMAASIFWLLPPVAAPIRNDGGLNLTVLGFTLAVCVGAALLSGLAPLGCSLRPDLHQVLKEGGRGEKSGGARSQRLRSLLVVSEVALAVLALVGAGLFLKSFQAARAVHPGFDPNRVLVARFQLASAGYGLPEQQAFSARLRRQLASAPGVTSVAYADTVPMSFSPGPWWDIDVEGYTTPKGQRLTVYRALVSPAYFDLLRIPLIEGRDFNEADDYLAGRVAIVNRTFARRYFGGRSPLGRHILWGSRGPVTIVGMVADSKYQRLTEAPRPFFYMPYRQVFSVGLETLFYVRTPRDPSSAIATVRREVAAIDPNADMLDAMPMTEAMGAALYPLKVAATMMAALGALAALLASVGLYSVMAYVVSQRTHEIGIRMALGAERRDVLAMVLRQALGLTAAGLAAGVAVALAAARLVSGMLVGVTAADPAAFAAAAMLLAAVAAVAGYVPARRATKADPGAALRCE